MSGSDQLKPGDKVVLYPRTGGPGVPAENPRLWGAAAEVLEVFDWGAAVRPADGGPSYRAGWGEMAPADDGVMDRPAVVDLPIRHATSANGFHSGVARRSRDQGYTGDVCPRCQGMRVRRAGKCAVCDDCGEGVGDCS